MKHGQGPGIEVGRYRHRPRGVAALLDHHRPSAFAIRQAVAAQVRDRRRIVDAVTVTSTVSVALEKAVVPPLLAVLTFVPAVPLVWSHARSVRAAVFVPL